MLFIWVKSLQKIPATPPPTQFAPASYGMRCISNNTGTGQTNIGGYTSSNPLDYTPQVCDVGLVCVKLNESDSTGFCKKAEGQPCTSVYECEPNLKYCSGVCSLTYVGGVNQEPPCLSDLVQENGLCKVPLGGKCTTTLDCANNTVYQCVTNDLSNPNSKTCIIPYDNGNNCIANSDCLSNNCDLSNSTDNDGLGICQPIDSNTGELGSVCIFYQSKTQDTACQSTLECNLNPDSTDTGTCLIPVFTWPNNSLVAECVSNACIPPTLCLNQTCSFPIPDPLSCSSMDSTGYCLSNYNCLNNRCYPDAGYPGLGSTWRLSQWIRSSYSTMGNWTPSVYLDPPGSNPSLTSYDHSTGTNFIYSADVSQNTNLSYKYNYIVNSTINNLVFNFVLVQTFDDYWINNTNPTVTPYYIHYTSSNSDIYVAILIKLTAYLSSVPYSVYFVLIGQITGNTLTANLPTFLTWYNYVNKTNLMPSTLPKDFSIDLRGLTRIVVSFPNNQIYVGSTNNLNPIPIFYISGSIFTPFGSSATNANYYYFKDVVPQQSYIDYSTANQIVVFPTTQTFGEATIVNMSTSTKISTPDNLEILFTSYTSLRNYLYYGYGGLWTAMPIDIDIKAIPLISVLDPVLDTSNRLPNLYILSTVI